jgi:circadian clock protein KaiC
MSKKVIIRRLATGVPGLDALLGGGIPEFSFNLIAGTPGAGKTTLAHQIMFSLASPTRRALFFTVLGEPPLKMLRYQQQFSFFNIDKVNTSIRFVNLAADLLDGHFDRVLARITEEVESFGPSLVFVDSFRSVVQSARLAREDSGLLGLQHFVQSLGVQMTSWQATTFLIGEYPTQEEESSPVFTVADGIVWMSQHVQGDAMVRKLQVVKMRGQAQRPGLHTFRISQDGVEVFPRALLQPDSTADLLLSGDQRSGEQRLTMGVPFLDEMMGGGLPAGYSLLVVGPSGCGKSVLATEFLAEGVRLGEPGVLAAFEKSPNQLLSHRLQALVQSGQVGVLDTRALDLSIDEILHDLVSLIKKMKARRVVIDSLSGLELALASVFRENFRESLYRLTAVLTSLGVTVLMNAELEDRYTDLRFSGYGNAFLTDAILMLRYVEIGGQFRRVVSVVKVRASAHSKDIRFFDIAHDSLRIGPALTHYQGILSGRPFLIPETDGPDQGPAA